MVVMSLGFASSGAQACHTDPFLVHWGDTLDVHMQLRSTEACRFGFNPGRASHVSAVVISQAPSHGTVSQADATHFVYHPGHGYAGPDVLKVTATGEQMGNRHIWSGDTNYTYDIQVAP
ncbi:hypothetical protein P7D22_15970 [Lichenihabitans sp. Uapishka_5]|uniref:Ig-like domain-containing protein n=1 Tax=Lichenihabitans sp. Uapishka_5 TaxID=3037302 RepID=UPI0029E81374|nr:Ig-like domain-containing protein [Lichenihabitans sp. Uapishka_5]MDX7952667.1 hypothetical protein [Lichenihabitans sp. Uapishka_5]